MSDQRLDDDDVRALFSDHLEEALDVETRAAVDAALAASSMLRADYAAFTETVSLLRTLPAEEAPGDLAQQVRRRLEAERRGSSSSSSPSMSMSSPMPSTLPTIGGTSWWKAAVGVSLAAAAAVALVVLAPASGGPAGMQQAGLVAAAAVPVQWQAPGIEDAVIAAAASAAGLQATQVDGDVVYVGDRDQAARFFVDLKLRCVEKGSDLSGMVPEQAARVQVRVGG